MDGELWRCMARAALTAWLALALASTPVAAQNDSSAPVPTLTGETFDATLKQHRLALVAFIAPWCQHSQALLPEMARAARTLQAQPGSDAGQPDLIFFAQVDGTVEEELAQAQGIESLCAAGFKPIFPGCAQSAHRACASACRQPHHQVVC